MIGGALVCHWFASASHWGWHSSEYIANNRADVSEHSASGVIAIANALCGSLLMVLIPMDLEMAIG